MCQHCTIPPLALNEGCGKSVFLFCWELRSTQFLGTNIKHFFFICTFLIRLVDSVYFLSTQFARTGFTDIVMRGLGSLNSMGQGPQSAVPMYNTNTLLNQLLCYGGGARTPIVSAHTYKACSWLNIESTHTLLWPVAFLGGWSKDPNLPSTLLGAMWSWFAWGSCENDGNGLARWVLPVSKNVRKQTPLKIEK